MPNAKSLANKEPGDNAYPDYARIRTLVVGAGTTVTKGNFYGILANGRIAGYSNSSHLRSSTLNGAVTISSQRFATTLLGGIVQAMTDAKAGERVQCFMPGSRVLAKLDQRNAKVYSLGPGALVHIRSAVGDAVLMPYDNAAGADEEITAHVGRVFECYTQTTVGPKPNYVTNGGELVVVDLGTG